MSDRHETADDFRDRLRGNIFTVNTDLFLSNIFPLESDGHNVDAILGTFCRDGHYDRARQEWTQLLSVPEKTDEVLAPFASVCNAIRDACATMAKEDVFCAQMPCHWYACPSRDYWSKRPKIFGGLDSPSQRIMEDIDRRRNMAEIPQQGAPHSASKNAEPDEKTRLLDAWWQRVQCPVEIIAENDEGSFSDAVSRLCRYMRRIFSRQLNRQFVIGLIICGLDMTVWLCDKSGLLGTSVPFNIHKSPEKLIRVIAGMSLLKPAQLGWDTTMRTIPAKHDTAVYTWDPIILKDAFASPYHSRWVIEMPSKENPEEREKFVTLQPLHISRSEMLWERGTAVWAVCRADEPPGPQRQIYALKQCSRGRSSIPEGIFYEEVEERSMGDSDTDAAHVSRLYSYEDVLIPGYPTDVLARLRGAVTEPEKESEARLKRYALFGDESIVQIRYEAETGQIGELKSKTRDPSYRVFSRILVEPYGWPLKFFKDRLELLVCLRDAIKAHRFLYRRGVLHRDISTGNILICPLAGDAEKTAGRLFDLDCGKLAEAEGSSEIAVTGVSPEDINKAERRFKLDYPAGIERAALERLVSFFPKGSFLSLVYVHSFLKCKPPASPQAPLTCADIGLLPEDEAAKMPKFGTHKSQQMHRTGTGPFMSSELATKTINFGDGDSDLVHDSIHDIESFMWVLIYLCCTRDGPGGSRRKEFRERFDTSKHQMLQAVVYYFFESPMQVMGYRKQGIFKKKRQMEDWLLPIFHDYFTPLKPLVRKWFEILFVGYRYRIYETIYDQFLKAIEEAIEEEENRGVEENPEILRMDPLGDYTEPNEGPSSSTLLQNDQSPSRPRSNSDRARLSTVLTGEPVPDDPFQDASQLERSQPEPKKLKTEPASKETTKRVGR
ncbi:hypothetical protein EVG20_g1347 [Dentipellis fragilis]|uniref:Fungal-type protein kinase domain-containing protein n=1 Tax=Dentipellis fragilis TaxID=205917 RepID=A0A4Y9ZCX7_9AGAM|nr:hypothetical protein EVG20_g1347 [Dentipellis fragilis]